MRLLALIRKELLVLRKDLHGLLVLFVMPAIFILIMSLAMRDTFGEQHQVKIHYLLHDSDRSENSTAFIDRLAQLPGFSLAKPAASQPDELERQVATDRYKFALLIPEGFGQRLVHPETADDTPLLELLLAPSVTPHLEMLFKISVEEQLTAMRLSPLLEQLPGESEDEDRIRQLTQGLTLKGRYVYQGTKPEKPPTSVQQSVPAWLVFAMFFVIIPLSTAFIVERQQGSLLRLRIMNISSLGLILGKVLPYYVINQIQMVLMVLVGIYLVPRFGGDSLQMGDSLLGLFIISSACSLAAIAFALLITTLANTHTQATTMGGVSNIIFGALGGVMVPKFVMPPFMQDLADISPMSWSLEGFLDIFLRNADWQAVLPEAGALLLFASGCLVLAAAAFSCNY